MSLNFEAITMFDKGTSLSFLGAFLPKITCYIFCVAGFISLFPLTYETFSFAIRQSNLFDVSKIQIYLFMFCEIAAPKRFPLIQTCLLLFHFLFSCYSFMHVIKVCLQLKWSQNFIRKNGITTHHWALRYNFLNNFCETIFYKLLSKAFLRFCCHVNTV